ncbi:MAG TPA: hypothetical protein VJ695_10545 [Nitrososphaera sp.]|nr:hypothetical protein [Nitrososphaera sp.]
MSNKYESLEKESIAREPKTNVENASAKKTGEGEYASVEDSPKGNQLRNTDEVVGTA